MIKGRVAPPKCLFHVATQIEKSIYTLIEQSAHLIIYYHHTTIAIAI